MIVLIHTICYAIAELSLPSWQKEVRDITFEVVNAMKEAKCKNAVWDVTWCMKYFASSHVNKPEFAYTEYLITGRISTRCFDVPVVVQKNIGKLLWIHVFHKFKGLFRYGYFFNFSVLRKEICHRHSSLSLTSWRFCSPFALVYQSFSSSAHNTLAPHFFNIK